MVAAFPFFIAYLIPLSAALAVAHAADPVVTLDEVPVATIVAGSSAEATLSISIADGHRVLVLERVEGQAPEG